LLTDCKAIGLFVIVNGQIAGFPAARADSERNAISDIHSRLN